MNANTQEVYRHNRGDLEELEKNELNWKPAEIKIQ